MKSLLAFFVLCAFSLYSQKDLLPIKGDFIYYEFKEKTSNKKHFIKNYFVAGETAGNLSVNIQRRVMDLNKISIGGGDPTVQFEPPIGMPSYDGKLLDCKEDIRSLEGLTVGLSSESSWLKNIFFLTRVNEDKLKVTGQAITAVVKLKFYSDNEYSLILTDFKIGYSGTKGKSIVTETLNLDDVYKSVQEKGKQDDKLYDRASESFVELDNMIKEISKIYSEELKRAIQLDEL